MIASSNFLYFPEQLTISLVDMNTRPVSGIVLMLTLYSRVKNDYHLRPKLSDGEGIVFVEKKWVRKSIEEIRNFFPMDYDSTIDECLPLVSIKNIGNKEIQNAISAMKLFEIENGGLGIAHSAEDLEKSNNDKYISKEIQINLNMPNEDNRKVVIELAFGKGL